jgi:hypothetical protein
VLHRPPAGSASLLSGRPSRKQPGARSQSDALWPDYGSGAHPPATCALRSDDTEARNEVRRCFGRSDRRAPPKRSAKLPGPLAGQYTAKNRPAAPVCCSGLFGPGSPTRSCNQAECQNQDRKECQTQEDDLEPVQAPQRPQRSHQVADIIPPGVHNVAERARRLHREPANEDAKGALNRQLIHRLWR